MQTETIQEINETFKTLVRQQVAKGGGTRWGEAESTEVIAGLVDLLVTNEDASTEGFDAIREKVSRVVNPSAFAQVLEKLPEGHASRIVRAKRGSGGNRAADL